MPDEWSDEELRASVEAYIDMMQKYNNSINFVKKRYYENLANTYGRTVKSFEYRMQNISYVFSLLGRSYLPGLKPKQNVGQKNIQRIEYFIANLENKPLIPTAAFESSVIELLKTNNINVPPQGIKHPSSSINEVHIYSRDPHVKAWVLNNADGVCELCQIKAPFYTFDDIPFLEVHHVKQLSDGGPDTISNTIAVCPNCHRELHYGKNRENIRNQLYSKIKRLINE